MKHLFIRFLLFYLFFIGISPINAQHRKSANPILSGFHADPEILYSRQTKCYYIYPTSDGFPGWGGSYFKVFSSRNLIEEKEIDGKYKYFFYYSANSVTNKGKQIGVATANSPTGPFTDSGKPIITSSPVGQGQQIDVDVFTDPTSGKSYLYWGNGYMAGAELNNDMLSVKEETITVMTPKGGTLQTYAFREAPYVFFRKGVYYFLWSVDDTGSPNYHVAYGTGNSPLGPIQVAKEPIILIQSPKDEIYGPAHCSVLQVPDKKDSWFIVYHRINKEYLKHGPGWHREVCIDRLEFNKDGTIKQVIPTP